MIHKLKNGSILTIRVAETADAKDIIEFVKKVGDETNFLTFESKDFTKTIKQEERIIKQHAENNNQVFLIGIISETIISVLNVEASQKPRLKHIGEFGISVLKEYWNLGIATHMLNEMISWAKESMIIRKINLGVHEENIGAIQLYEKLGFEKEGCRSRGIKTGDDFYDTILMGMFID